MKIKITQQNIDDSEIAEGARSQTCPVALGLKAAFPKMKYIHVGDQTTIIGNKCYDLPTIAKQFIDDFDYGNKDGLKPFEFEMDIKD